MGRNKDATPKTILCRTDRSAKHTHAHACRHLRRSSITDRSHASMAPMKKKKHEQTNSFPKKQKEKESRHRFKSSRYARMTPILPKHSLHLSQSNHPKTLSSVCLCTYFTTLHYTTRHYTTLHDVSRRAIPCIWKRKKDTHIHTLQKGTVIHRNSGNFLFLNYIYICLLSITYYSNICKLLVLRQGRVEWQLCKQ